MRRVKMFKKLVAFLLVMVFVTNIQCANANASEKKEDGLIAYVESMLPQYLLVNELFAGEYKVSEPITLYDWETGESEKTLFLVFEGNQVVGRLVVQCYEGEYCSSFTKSNSDVLTKVYREKTPVAFGSYNECFVMRTETENVLLSNSSKENPLRGLSDSTQRRASKLNCLQSIKLDDSMKVKSAVMPRTTVYNKKLGVKRVENTSVNGKGLCWATCVASKVRYQTGTVLSALDVYHRLICIYDGTPIGIELWVDRAYPLYNVNVTRVSNCISAGACFTQLNNRKPIHMSIKREGGSHDVLLAGVYYTDVSNAGGLYTIMDSNYGDTEDDLVTVGVSPSVIRNGSGFTYVADYGYTYTEWYRTWY